MQRKSIYAAITFDHGAGVSAGGLRRRKQLEQGESEQRRERCRHEQTQNEKPVNRRRRWAIVFATGGLGDRNFNCGLRKVD